MQNKARLELADYEAENLARLQKMFSRKWEFIFMQAEAQSRVDKKRDKLERKVLDSQERAFWDVHRPVVCCRRFYFFFFLFRFYFLLCLDLVPFSWYWTYRHYSFTVDGSDYIILVQLSEVWGKELK